MEKKATKHQVGKLLRSAWMMNTYCRGALEERHSAMEHLWNAGGTTRVGAGWC